MNNRSLIPAVRKTTRYHLGPYDRIVIKDTSFRHVRTNDNGHLLSRDGDIQVTEFFSHADFEALFQNNELAVSYGWHRSSEAELRGLNDNTRFSDLPVEEQTQIFMRRDLVEAIEAALESGRLRSRSDDCLRAFINQEWPRIMKNAAARLGVTLKFGSKKKGAVEYQASPTSARDWRKRLEAANGNLMALRDGKHRSGNRTPRIDHESSAVAKNWAEKYLDRRKVSMRRVHAEYMGHVKSTNLDRKKEGRRPLAHVSLRTFQRIIGGFDKYLVCLAREGETAARNKYSPARAGLYASRPAERVEMDDLTMNEFVWNVTRAEFDRMSSSEQEAVEKVRPNLTAALDWASECVMSYVVRGTAPSSDSAITCLEMCGIDKTAFAELIGAETPWDMAARIEGVAFDTGPAFMANATHAVLHDMKAKYLHPATGQPQLRGKMERFFRTVNEGFTQYLTAQTYRNVVEKGDYNPEANVCLCIDELAELLGRWIVDEYHNSPHDSLGGLTPRLAWLELTERFPVQMPPGPEERRHIFGMRCERQIQKRGIRIMGIHYQSRALQQLRRSVGQLPVDVKIDRQDLSEISVWDPKAKAWMQVKPAAADLDLRGVSYAEWVAAGCDMRRKNADLSSLSSGIVAKAIRDIRAKSEAEIRRAGLHSHIMNLNDLPRVEREFFATFNYVSDGSTPTDESIEESSGFALNAPTREDASVYDEFPEFSEELSGNSADSDDNWSWE